MRRSLVALALVAGCSGGAATEDAFMAARPGECDVAATTGACDDAGVCEPIVVARGSDTPMANVVTQSIAVDDCNVYFTQVDVDAQVRSLRQIAKAGGSPITLATDLGPEDGDLVPVDGRVYFGGVGLSEVPIGGGSSQLAWASAARVERIAVTDELVYWIGSSPSGPSSLWRIPRRGPRVPLRVALGVAASRLATDGQSAFVAQPHATDERIDLVRVDPDGSSHVVVAGERGAPQQNGDLAVDGTELFWIDDLEEIRHAPRAGGAATPWAASTGFASALTAGPGGLYFNSSLADPEGIFFGAPPSPPRLVVATNATAIAVGSDAIYFTTGDLVEKAPLAR